MKELLAAKIVELEWKMFSNVSNVGGKASCQLDPVTFEIMRHSQVSAWPEKLLESYLDDLSAAARQNRNLMSEKYARMMESTFPGEYKALAGRLPEIDEKTLRLIDDVAAIHLEWKEESSKNYPRLSNKGRPVRAKDDTPYDTSFETYLRGELKTYSPKTVSLLHEHTKNLKNNGLNGVEITLLNQVKRYGYTSLAEAEKRQGITARFAGKP